MVSEESDVFRTLTDEEKQRTHEKAQELIPLLSSWASGYPVVRAKRIPPVAVLIATVLPLLPQPAALIVGKLILFIFAVDDLADERLLSLEDFIQAGRIWHDVALHGKTDLPPVDDSSLTKMIAEIRGDLSQFSLFSKYVSLWASRLSQLCEAMANEYIYGLEHQKSGGKKLPGFDEYLAGGIHSVGFPFWGTSILILLSEPETLAHLNKIENTILQTGAAIRLYNDVRTYEKEVQEANINAITILQNAIAVENGNCISANLFQQAHDGVLSLARQYAEKCLFAAGQPVSETGQFEIMIRRIVAFHANFYGSRKHRFDYHTISSSDSFSMIEGASPEKCQEVA